MNDFWTTRKGKLVHVGQAANEVLHQITSRQSDTRKVEQKCEINLEQKGDAGILKEGRELTNAKEDDMLAEQQMEALAQRLINQQMPLHLSHGVAVWSGAGKGPAEAYNELETGRRGYLFYLVRRCLQGDWGLIDKEDWEANNFALEHGGRILAAYPIPPALAGQEKEDRIWMIIEADRSAVTLMFPKEY